MQPHGLRARAAGTVLNHLSRTLALSVAVLAVVSASRLGGAEPQDTHSDASSVSIGPATRGRFVDAAEASRILTRRDAFVAAMSPFDRSARLEVSREVSESEYLSLVSKETLDWSAAERELLRTILEDFRVQTARWKLDLPAEVLLLKTTGREEGRAAYCRGAAVILPQSYFNPERAALRQVVFHELFHVFSSHHPDMRRALYAVVGYEVCPEIRLPPRLARVKLTNPDAPRMDAFIRLRVGDERLAAAPVLLGRSELYDEHQGGPFFRQMDFRFLVLERECELKLDGDSVRPAILPDGRPRLLVPSEVPDYEARIGRNTDYVIHPEEILADNFVLLADPQNAKIPTPEILDKLDAVLRR